VGCFAFSQIFLSKVFILLPAVVAEFVGFLVFFRVVDPAFFLIADPDPDSNADPDPVPDPWF
jgi:hypothetical protein